MQEATIRVPSAVEVLTNLANTIAPFIKGRERISRHEVCGILRQRYQPQNQGSKRAQKKDYLYLDDSSPYFRLFAEWSYGSVRLKAVNKTSNGGVNFNETLWEVDTDVYNNDGAFYYILGEISGVVITDTPSRFSLLKAIVKGMRGDIAKASKHCSYSYRGFEGYHISFGFSEDDPIMFSYYDIYHGEIKDIVFSVGGDEAIGLVKRITGNDPQIEVPIVKPLREPMQKMDSGKCAPKLTKHRYIRGEQMEMF